MTRAWALSFSILAAGCGDDDSTSSMTSSTTGMTFFVTSATSVTGNLVGLAGADATCQRLATAVGEGARAWRAYLSVEHDATNGNQPTNARDRIGAGPWRNANNVVVANNLAELHARSRRGTRRTRIRTARTQLRAVGQGGSIASLAKRAD